MTVNSGGTFGGNGRIAPTGSNGVTIASGGNLAPGGVQTNVGTFNSYSGNPTNVVNGKLTMDTTNFSNGSELISASTGAQLTFALGAGGAGPTNSAQSISQLLVSGSANNIMDFNLGGTSGVGGTSSIIAINDLIGTATTLSDGTAATEYVLIAGNGSTIYEDNGVDLGSAGDLGGSTALGQEINGGLTFAPVNEHQLFQRTISECPALPERGQH